MRLTKLVKRHIDRKSVVFGEGGKHLEIIEVAAVPSANSTFGQCERLIDDDSILIEELFEPRPSHDVQAPAGLLKENKRGSSS